MRTACAFAAVFLLCLLLSLDKSLGSNAHPSPSSIRFELRRLDAPLNHHPTPRKYLIETMAGGVAAFDYDGDGLPDLYFTNGADAASLKKVLPADSNRLFHNDGNLQFTDVTATSGLAGEGFSIGVAAADFDNDGREDLFVAGLPSSRLYRNEGNGHFQDVTAKAGLALTDWAVGGAWLDYDHDGLLDLFVVNYLQWSAATDPHCTQGQPPAAVYCHPARFAGLPNRLFRNRGDGTFEDVSVKSGIAKLVGKGMSASVADYDGDGYPDIFVTNDALPNFLFHNLRNGRFSDTSLEAGVALTDKGAAVSGMGSAFRDYDNDGKPDILFTALQGETFPLFRNLGDGLFEDRGYASRLAPLTIRQSGWGVAMVDLDNDGWKDIFSANAHVTDNIEMFSGDRYKLPNRVFRNLGNGTFADVSETAGSALQTPRAHRGLAAADLDNDGRMDIVTTALGEKPEIWHNVSQTANHWLSFHFGNGKKRRTTLGTTVCAGARCDTSSPAYSYASSNDSRVHLGLGPKAETGSINVRWPDGHEQVQPSTAIDKSQLLQESR